MPRRKKKATEMTTEELARRVFPKEVVEELERIAHEQDEKADKVEVKDEKPSSKTD
jgi:hypothetical protein